MEKYELLRKLADGLYCVDGDWGNTPFRRRMTVVVLGSGDVVIHSAIQMSDADMAALDQLGRVSLIIAPNIMHGSEAQWYADRYPTAKVLVPYDAGGRLRKVTRIDGALEDDWPSFCGKELEVAPVLGTRLHEAVLYHRPSRTLIVADLVFNLSSADFKTGWFRRLMRWNGIVDHFGPSQVFQKLLVVDRYKLRRSIEHICEWEFDRVVLSHGKIVEADGRERLRAAFAPLFARMPERRSEARDDDGEGDPREAHPSEKATGEDSATSARRS